LIIYDINSGSILFSYINANVQFTNAKFRADDKMIVVGDTEGNIHVLDGETGDCNNIFKVHQGELKIIEFSPIFNRHNLLKVHV